MTVTLNDTECRQHLPQGELTRLLKNYNRRKGVDAILTPETAVFSAEGDFTFPSAYYPEPIREQIKYLEEGGLIPVYVQVTHEIPEGSPRASSLGVTIKSEDFHSPSYREELLKKLHQQLDALEKRAREDQEAAAKSKLFYAEQAKKRAAKDAFRKVRHISEQGTQVLCDLKEALDKGDLEEARLKMDAFLEGAASYSQGFRDALRDTSGGPTAPFMLHAW